MSPYEQAPVTDAEGEALTDGGEATVELWLPYQYRWRDVLTLGLVVAVLGAHVAYLTASPFLAFGISVVALVFLNAGVVEIPVTHYVSLPASTAVLALVDAPVTELTPTLVAGAAPLWVAPLSGAGFGIVGAMFGEVHKRILYAEIHLDPPAARIVVTSFPIPVLATGGMLASSVEC